MADSSAIDTALIGKLLADSTLMALVPDGVYSDEAKPGAERFVIVSMVESLDEPVFGERAFEDALYLVKAVMLSSAGGNIASAAARIDVLLEQGTLAPTGYSLMSMRREERIRITEVDEVDPSIRWMHRGGRYRIVVSL